LRFERGKEERKKKTKQNKIDFVELDFEPESKTLGIEYFMQEAAEQDTKLSVLQNLLHFL
jgi:hypothetical protein